MGMSIKDLIILEQPIPLINFDHIRHCHFAITYIDLDRHIIKHKERKKQYAQCLYLAIVIGMILFVA